MVRPQEKAMTVLDANLKQAISDRCMHGPNVTLNANLVIQLIEYINKLEKVAREAADVEKLKNSLERCAQTAAITNTCRVVNPQGFSMYPAVDAMQEGESQVVKRAIVGQCDSLQSTLRTMSHDDLRQFEFDLDAATNIVTMVNKHTGERSTHLLSNVDVERIKSPGRTATSMAAVLALDPVQTGDPVYGIRCRTSLADVSTEEVRKACPDLSQMKNV
jgi:hypothetical protein